MGEARSSLKLCCFCHVLQSTIYILYVHCTSYFYRCSSVEDVPSPEDISSKKVLVARCSRRILQPNLGTAQPGYGVLTKPQPLVLHQLPVWLIRPAADVAHVTGSSTWHHTIAIVIGQAGTRTREYNYIEVLQSVQCSLYENQKPLWNFVRKVPDHMSIKHYANQISNQDFAQGN